MVGTGGSGSDDVLRSPSAVRETNMATVVRLLRESGPLSRAELVRASGLARPTVMAIVSSLLAAGVAVERGTRPAKDLVLQRGGRPGTLLSYNTAATTIMACRLGRNEISLDQRGADGSQLAQTVLPMSTWQPEHVLDLVVAQVRRMQAGHGSLGALSVTVAGITDGGTVTSAGRGWDRVPVQADLEDRLGVPVTILGPAAAAVVGEVASGAAQGHQDVVLVFLAKGIAAGLLADGRLLRGSGGAFGELGHCYAFGDQRCACGRRGCLETVAAGWALRRSAAEVVGRHVAEELDLRGLAALNDASVDLALENAARALGAATSWLVNLLSPSVVVLGATGFARGAETFFDDFAESVREHALTGEDVRVVRGTEDAVAHGAVHAALEHLPSPMRPRLLLGA